MPLPPKAAAIKAAFKQPRAAEVLPFPEREKTPPPVRKPSDMSAAFKEAGRAVLVPGPKPVKKTTKRGGDDDEALRYSTESIVEKRLGLCRDPTSNLPDWIEFCRRAAFSKSNILEGTHVDTIDRKAAVASAAEFFRNTLQELSGVLRADNNGRQNFSHVSDRSTDGVADSGQLQQVQAGHGLSHGDASHRGDNAEIAAITGQYGALIANARDGLRCNDPRRREAARGLVLRLMDEQAAAIRSAEERQRAELRNQHTEPPRPDSAPRRPPRPMRLH